MSEAPHTIKSSPMRIFRDRKQPFGQYPVYRDARGRASLVPEKIVALRKLVKIHRRGMRLAIRSPLDVIALVISHSQKVVDHHRSRIDTLLKEKVDHTRNLFGVKKIIGIENRPLRGTPPHRR